MNYILVSIDGIGNAYQESSTYGEVVRYLDQSGTELFLVVPDGHGSLVIEQEPPRQPWML